MRSFYKEEKSTDNDNGAELNKSVLLDEVILDLIAQLVREELMSKVIVENKRSVNASK